MPISDDPRTFDASEDLKGVGISSTPTTSRQNHNSPHCHTSETLSQSLPLSPGPLGLTATFCRTECASDMHTTDATVIPHLPGTTVRTLLTHPSRHSPLGSVFHCHRHRPHIHHKACSFLQHDMPAAVSQHELKHHASPDSIHDTPSLDRLTDTDAIYASQCGKIHHHHSPSRYQPAWDTNTKNETSGNTVDFITLALDAHLKAQLDWDLAHQDHSLQQKQLGDSTASFERPQLKLNALGRPTSTTITFDSNVGEYATSYPRISPDSMEAGELLMNFGGGLRTSSLQGGGMCMSQPDELDQNDAHWTPVSVAEYDRLVASRYHPFTQYPMLVQPADYSYSVEHAYATASSSSSVHETRVVAVDNTQEQGLQHAQMLSHMSTGEDIGGSEYPFTEDINPRTGRLAQHQSDAPEFCQRSNYQNPSNGSKFASSSVSISSPSTSLPNYSSELGAFSPPFDQIAFDDINVLQSENKSLPPQQWHYHTQNSHALLFSGVISGESNSDGLLSGTHEYDTSNDTYYSLSESGGDFGNGGGLMAHGQDLDTDDAMGDADEDYASTMSHVSHLGHGPPSLRRLSLASSRTSFGYPDDGSTESMCGSVSGHLDSPSNYSIATDDLVPSVLLEPDVVVKAMKHIVEESPADAKASLSSTLQHIRAVLRKLGVREAEVDQIEAVEGGQYLEAERMMATRKGTNLAGRKFAVKKSNPRRSASAALISGSNFLALNGEDDPDNDPDYVEPAKRRGRANTESSSTIMSTPKKRKLSDNYGASAFPTPQRTQTNTPSRDTKKLVQRFSRSSPTSESEFDLSDSCHSSDDDYAARPRKRPGQGNIYHQSSMNASDSDDDGRTSPSLLLRARNRWTAGNSHASSSMAYPHSTSRVVARPTIDAKVKRLGTGRKGADPVTLIKIPRSLRGKGFKWDSLVGQNSNNVIEVGPGQSAADMHAATLQASWKKNTHGVRSRARKIIR
ncbi:hypothetical protein DFS34DRAFT_650696 [Phlyctochytrium arcticum]|nr:hypothetical protein DFS34DRAFT_650696 [Phlyctochytrium arcticum]